VRLTEKSGDVHISLHSTDPALAGRMTEGVHDLVGSLSSAGYEAQAWTAADQRREHQRQPEQQPGQQQGRRQGSPGDSSMFDDMLQKENA
jgi:hypothetical protein